MNFKEFFQKWIYNDEPDEPVEDSDSEFQQDFQELEGKENYDAFVIVYKPTCFDDVKAKDGMIAKIYQNVFIVSPKNIGVIEE